METFVKIFIDQFKVISQYNGGTPNPAATWMWILGIIGFFSFAMIADRLMILFKARIDKKNLIDPLLTASKQKDRNKALKICEKKAKEGSPFAEIVHRGLTADEVDSRYNFNFAVHEAKLEIYPKLRKRTNFISLLQGVATLIGLAGTIFGLILAFDAVGGKDASESSRMLAAGISAAMGTTIGGLFIAIPTLTIGHIISHKIEALIKKSDLYIGKIKSNFGF